MMGEMDVEVQVDGSQPDGNLEIMRAVDDVAGISARLLYSLETTAPPKNREEEAAKAKARAAERFGAAG